MDLSTYRQCSHVRKMWIIMKECWASASPKPLITKKQLKDVLRGLIWRRILASYKDLRAGIAQLIERRLAKAKVAGLSPVSRSIFKYVKSCIKAYLARII